MTYKTVAINEMRWRVVLAKRTQIPTGAAGIAESLVDQIRVHAKVEDAFPQTFIGSAQTDRPVTHMIWIRWVGWLDQTFVIVRVTELPNGTPRCEVFRIRRVKELDGRKRFLEIEVELEVRE